MQIGFLLYDRFTALDVTGPHDVLHSVPGNEPIFVAERPGPARVVEHGKLVTAAGVSSGIDMALRLVQRIHGDEVAQAVQLLIEYDPQPPLDAGSPEKAPQPIVDLVTAAFAAQEQTIGSQ